MNPVIRNSLSAAIGLLCAFAGIAGAVTIYVDAANPTPPGDGSVGNPFSTISNAVVALAGTNALAQGGHTISVAAGTYAEPITLASNHSGLVSAPNTVMAPTGGVTVSGFGITLNACSNMVLNHLSVKGAAGTTNGIYVTGDDSDNFVITNCTVALGAAAGIYVYNNNTGGAIVNCVVYGNLGNGLEIWSNCGTPLVSHSAIVGNGGNGVWQYLPTVVRLRNCIIAGNGSFGANEGHNQGDIVPSFCLFFANRAGHFYSYEYSGGVYYVDIGNTVDAINSLSGGSNSIVANPGFSDVASGWNFNGLYADSPCLNAGEGGSDIGPYENPPLLPVSSNTYYVSASIGDDGRTAAMATNSASPWASVTNAARTAIAGDTVVVAAGVYTGRVHVTRGGGRQPVTYRAAGAVKITGADYGFYLDRVANVALEDFELAACKDAGLYAYYSMSNTVWKGSIHNNATNGAVLWGSACNVLDGLMIYSNVNYGVLTQRYSGGNEVLRSTLFSQGYGIGTAFSTVGRLTSRISNCNLYRHSQYAIQTHSGGGTLLENSVLYTNVNGFYSGAGGGASVVRNCIIASNTQRGLYEAHTQGDFSILNCCFTNNPVGHFIDEATTTNNTPSEINGVAGNSNNIVADPQFKNAAAGDFRLKVGSMCINAGTTNTSLATDLYGNPRLVGLAVDIGSFEMQLPGGTVFVVR